MQKPIGATQEQLDANNIEWVLCGGLNIGLNRQPQKWQLRHSNECDWAKEKSMLLREMANLSRKIYELENDCSTLICSMTDPSVELDGEIESLIEKYGKF